MEIKFTYIVPTILKFEKFEDQIIEIAKSQYINDIVIINNSGKNYNPTNVGGALYECRHKLLIVNPRHGLYCNGAWNVGVKYSKKESNFAILATDDIIFDSYVIDLVAEQIEDLPNMGILGMDANVITDKQLEDLNYIYIEEAGTQREYGFGLLMFLRKKDYIQIPEGIKHWYGDDFLYYSMLDKNKKNYLVKSDTFKINTIPGSMSTDDSTRLRIAADKQFWMSEFYNKYRNYGDRCG